MLFLNILNKDIKCPYRGLRYLLYALNIHTFLVILFILSILILNHIPSNQLANNFYDHLFSVLSYLDGLIEDSAAYLLLFSICLLGVGYIINLWSFYVNQFNKNWFYYFQIVNMVLLVLLAYYIFIF